MKAAIWATMLMSLAVWYSANANDYLYSVPGNFELHDMGAGRYSNPANGSTWQDHGHEIQNQHTGERLINHNNGVYQTDTGKTCTGIGGGRIYCY